MLKFGIRKRMQKLNQNGTQNWPQKTPGCQNGSWEQNQYKRLLKMDTKIGPAKTPKNRFRRATHENMKNATKYLREYEFDPPKTKNCY